MIFPPASLMINNDLSDNVQQMLVRQLHIDIVLNGQTFNANMAANSDYAAQIKANNQRLMVIESLICPHYVCDVDIVLFAKTGLVTILRNKHWPTKDWFDERFDGYCDGYRDGYRDDGYCETQSSPFHRPLRVIESGRKEQWEQKDSYDPYGYNSPNTGKGFHKRGYPFQKQPQPADPRNVRTKHHLYLDQLFGLQFRGLELGNSTLRETFPSAVTLPIVNLTWAALGVGRERC
jgi:hypothetical protein